MNTDHDTVLTAPITVIILGGMGVVGLIGMLVALIAAAPNAFRDKPLSGRRKSVVTGGLITFGLLWGASLYAYMTLELSEFINHLLKRC